MFGQEPVFRRLLEWPSGASLLRSAICSKRRT
ncbi:MAG: hypothetical protein GEU87_12895 [Alphaproteobacteria bacterium]|nr:hypothetical protein [Alphaproteobacteria bacterium]